MAVQILVSLGGGGGTDFLDTFLDTLTMGKGPVDENIHPVEAPDFTMMNTMASTMTLDKGTPAARGAVILPTLDGWWDGAAYSGSGNFLNAGTKGSAWDLILGAAGAAPSFSSGVFTFDGVDDYMRILDIDSLDLVLGESITLGMICTPLTSLITGTCFISKTAGEGANLGYQLRISTAAVYLYENDNGTAIGSPVTLNTATGTKAMHVGTLNRQAPMVITAHRSAGGTLSSTASSAIISRGALNNTSNLVVGARSDLTGFLKMDMNALFIAKRSLSFIDLQAIAAYYGV